LVGLMLVGVMMLALAIPEAGAAVSQESFGMTNAIAKNATITANLGSGVKVDNYESVDLLIKVYNAHTDTGNVTVYFARSGDGSTWETSPKFSTTFALTAAQASNTAQYFWVHLPSTTIGSAMWIKPTSVANTNANSDLTNCAVYVWKKRGAGLVRP